MDNKTDAELVALARSGNKDAFGCLIGRYQMMAKYAATRMVNNEDIAQELAQESLLRAYLSVSNLRDDSSFKTWLYGIVLNVCREYLRDQKYVVVPFERLVNQSGTDANTQNGTAANLEQFVEERDLRQQIEAAIHDLSVKNKDAVLMFYYDQLTLQEIARNLRISVVAVKGRLHKARGQLRADLLPLHPIQSSARKEHTMIKVTIGDVVWIKQEERNQCVILLLDEVGRRALPIWVGSMEAEPIARGLHHIASPRPLTLNFRANLLEASNIRLEAVRIESLKNEIYYAVAQVRNQAGVREIDARPSDALSLAGLMGSPLYFSRNIPEQVWITAKKSDAHQLLPDKGSEALMDEIRAILENQVNPQQFVSASMVAQLDEEVRKTYLKNVGFSA